MHTTFKQRAYEHIRQGMLTGRLLPGARLSNRALANEIGASLIPVREAISQLVSEGLAEHRPRMGAFVMQVDREELAELYDLREALECHAIRRAVADLTDVDLEEMQRSNDQLSELMAVVAQQPDH
ncbi:MAG: GntR family transcriptional regulator, partial [Pirellulales bacterium]|nr:GntR family transcriptional regulator [Pirellulales bacterium]